VKKAGLFRLSLPASLGGWKADPITIFEVIEKLRLARLRPFSMPLLQQ